MAEKCELLQVRLAAFAFGVLSCACNPFKSVGISVRTQWVGSPAQRVVQVEFWKRGDCFTIPSGTRVLLNGEPLHLSMAGGKRPPPSRPRPPAEPQGLDWPIPNCLPAYFTSEPFAPGEAKSDRIAVEMLGKTGLVEIRGLLAQRALRVTSGSLESGKDVTLEWTPTTDSWPERMVGAEVYVDSASGQRLIIAGSAVDARLGRFRFRLPQLQPGMVQLSVNAGATRPRAPVWYCQGFTECISGEVFGPPPIEVQVR